MTQDETGLLGGRSYPEWTAERLRELAFQAAGAASVPFMEDHPDYVMPSERILAGVDRVLRDFGVPDA